MEIVTKERLEKALKYLAHTDDQAARAKAYLAGLEEQKKTIYAIEFNKQQGGVEVSKNLALQSGAYQEHLKKIEEAIYDFELLRNKRITESLIVEVWRSENANRRKGNI